MNIDLMNLFGDAPIWRKRDESESEINLTANDVLHEKKVVALFFSRWTGPNDAK